MLHSFASHGISGDQIWFYMLINILLLLSCKWQNLFILGYKIRRETWYFLLFFFRLVTFVSLLVPSCASFELSGSCTIGIVFKWRFTYSFVIHNADLGFHSWDRNNFFRSVYIQRNDRQTFFEQCLHYQSRR